MATAATCAFCLSIDAANSLPSPGIMICPVAVIFATIAESLATTPTSLAMRARAAAGSSGEPKMPTSPSKSSEG